MPVDYEAVITTTATRASSTCSADDAYHDHFFVGVASFSRRKSLVKWNPGCSLAT